MGKTKFGEWLGIMSLIAAMAILGIAQAYGAEVAAPTAEEVEASQPTTLAPPLPRPTPTPGD